MNIQRVELRIPTERCARPRVKYLWFCQILTKFEIEQFSMKFFNIKLNKNLFNSSGVVTRWRMDRHDGANKHIIEIFIMKAPYG